MNWMVFISEQWLLVGLLLVLVTALIWVEGSKGGKKLNCNEMTRLVNQGEAVMLDVRDNKEYKAGHIVGAINIPHAKLGERMAELKKYQDKTIVIVDKMGQHAGAAGKLLKDNGYTATRLQGGMTEWVGQSLPVTKE